MALLPSLPASAQQTACARSLLHELGHVVSIGNALHHAWTQHRRGSGAGKIAGSGDLR
jgi:hypothetical protein